MKKTLTVLSMICLSSCVPQKQFYTVCPVAVPPAWNKAPEGTFQYRKLSKGIYACTKDGVCNVTRADWKIFAQNVNKCEHTRQALVDLLEGINDPVPLDLPKPIQEDVTNTLLPKSNIDELKFLDFVPIVESK